MEVRYFLGLLFYNGIITKDFNSGKMAFQHFQLKLNLKKEGMTLSEQS